MIKKGGQVVQETTREHRLTAWIKDVEDQLEQGAVQVKELQLELAEQVVLEQGQAWLSFCPLDRPRGAVYHTASRVLEFV